ncbi:MAG: endonuclease [bacterium]
MQKIYLYFCLFFTLLLSLQAQNDDYYNTINPANSGFVGELQSRIRSPYTKISYNNFDETNIANFASRDTTNGQKVVTCVYSGENYVYTPPFTWTPFSREHTWCHSWMPSYDSESGEEYSDQHHLFPTNQNNANGVRSNHPLGIVTTITSSYLLCKYGKNTSNENVFESRDSHKGDAARALLYMSLRYNGINGLDWTFNHLNTVTLPALSEAPQNLALLIQWHKADPPDQWEVERNDYIEGVQKNRNPFVDHPEYVNYIDFNDLSKLSPAYATEPTNFPTPFSANASGSSITLSWTDAAAGDQVPQGYFIEAYAKNAYFIPIDGSTYDVDTDLSDGKALVYVDFSAANTYTFNSLVGGTTYYFKVYSYYGSGAQTNYKTTSTAPTANAVASNGMATEPSNYPTALLTSNISESTIQLNWTDATGTTLPTGYLIKINTANSFTNPVDGTPIADETDFSDGIGVVNVTHSGNDFYSFTGLNAATTYYFQVYSYSGSSVEINYKIDGTIPNTQATTLAQEPQNHVTNFATDNITTSEIRVTWTEAVGSPLPTGYLIKASTTNSFTDPIDAVAVSDDTNLSDGSAVVNVTFAGNDYYSFTGLSAATTYYFRIYSYTGSSTTINYKTDGTIPNTQAATLAQEPQNHVINFATDNITSGGIRVTWTEAVGSPLPIGYLIKASTTNSFTDPVDGVADTNDTNLSDGSAVVNVTYAGNDYYSFSGLSASTIYYFKIYSYSGSDASINYKTDGVPTTNATTLASSGSSADLFISEYVEGGSSNKYIELFNGTGASVDLSNYKLQLYSNGSAIPTNENTLTGTLANNSTIVYKNSLAAIYAGDATILTSVNFNGDDAVALYKISPSGFIDIFGQIGADPGTAWTDESSGNTTLNKTLRRKSSVTHGITTNPTGFPTLGTEWDMYNQDIVSGLGSHTSALPVELNSFGGVFLNNQIQLNWQTASEINNYGFEIEKKSEYTNWEKIGFITGNGNSNVTNFYTFTDKQVLPATCYYKLKQIDNDGTFKYSETIKIESGIKPDNFILYQNYPNPFNPSTVINYYVPQKNKVSLVVYDMLGKVIAELVNEEKESGLYSVNFDSNNISSGVYFYTLQSGEYTKTNKMTLLR